MSKASTMTPAAVICSAIGGRNPEDRTADVLTALTREGWAFIKASDAPSARGGAVAADVVNPFLPGGLGSRLLDAIHEYRKDYVYSTDDVEHIPTEWEAVLLEDFVAGIGGDDAFCEIVRDAAFAPQSAQPADAVWEALDVFWDDLVNKDDRTSPEDCPDHALITKEELGWYLARAAHASDPAPATDDRERLVGTTSLSLAECPVGLFRAANGELCLKTEYGSSEGRIDAYIVSSGEFFWGAAPQTIESQRAQLVWPVIALPSGAALIPSDALKADWRDDPSADERWNAGVDYAQQRLCKVLGVNPDDVTWDAATETLDGDIEAVIANILTKAMGERWRPKTTGTQRSHAAAFEAVREEHARQYVLNLLKEIDTNRTSKSVVVAQLRSAALVPAGESGMELLDRMANDGLVDVTGMTVELTEEGFRVAESVRRP